MSEDVCRTCLGDGANIYLFDPSGDLTCKLTECVHIVISEADGFPSKICQKCCSELNLSYNFINKCKASDNYLKMQVVQLDSNAEDKVTDPIKVEYDFLEENVYEDHFSNENMDVKETITESSKEETRESDYKQLEPFNFLNYTDNSDKEFGKIFSTVLLNNSECNKRNDELCKRKGKLGNKANRTKVKRRRIKLFVCKGEQQCPVCGLRVVSASALSIHSRTHTGEKPFQCASCEKSFALKSTLEEHVLRLHSNAEKTITCESCGKQFYKERDLVVHMRVHTKEAPYLCPHCPQRFTQHASIIKHIRIHTGERPFACKTCGKTFTSQSHVKSHESTHSDLRPHKCDTCGKAVKNKHSLVQHIKRHRGGKDFICDQCGSSFSTKGNLVVHVTMCHSETSGICHICSKNCSNLENHLKIHTGELLFECQFCHKKFRKCNLSNHLLKHTNSGKFKCEVDKCVKTFSTKNLLEFHFLKHHLKTPRYSCNLCMKGFYRPCDLATHTRRSHGNKLPTD